MDQWRDGCRALIRPSLSRDNATPMPILLACAAVSLPPALRITPGRITVTRACWSCPDGGAAGVEGQSNPASSGTSLFARREVVNDRPAIDSSEQIEHDFADVSASHGSGTWFSFRCSAVITATVFTPSRSPPSSAPHVHAHFRCSASPEPAVSRMIALSQRYSGHRMESTNTAAMKC